MWSRHVDENDSSYKDRSVKTLLTCLQPRSKNTNVDAQFVSPGFPVHELIPPSFTVNFFPHLKFSGVILANLPIDVHPKWSQIQSLYNGN